MIKNKKIVVVLPNLSGGGAQWVLYKLSYELVKVFEVIIITFESNKKKYNNDETINMRCDVKR